jgi:eukaryotic-like serine/threonine-protein kinase
MAVTSAEEFFAVLEKSKLLIPAQLAQARRIAGPSDDPRAIAKSLAHQGVITRWQAGQLLAGRSSFYLGKYRLIELLGRDSTGNVLLGEHVTMNRRVALKVVPRPLCKDPAALTRFLAQVPAIAALDHPNIVRVYNVDNQGDRYYLAMEYIEGVDLQRLVEQQGPLDGNRAAGYIGQAADGLDHGHRQNMTHGGIKPSRLLVNQQGVVKILDFGLIWLAEAPMAADEVQVASGWVDYLAPERAQTGSCADARADIYSLGCTLYFLLGGHPPYSQAMPLDRMETRPTQPPPDLRARRPMISADLAAICAKMMSPKPEDRYRTAAEVSHALAQWRASMLRSERARTLPMAKRLEEP